MGAHVTCHPPAERAVERHCGLEPLQAHLGERIWAIYTRDQLIDAMYRDERVVSDRTVDSHVKKIRKKIAAVLPEREIIHSLYGVGYKYEW